MHIHTNVVTNLIFNQFDFCNTPLVCYIVKNQIIACTRSSTLPI